MKRTFALSTLACLLVASLEGGAQQLTWRQNPANGHWYALASSKTTWLQAQSDAAQIGGHLATVRSQAEHDWIVSTFVGTPQTPVWIGLTDQATEGVWLWENEEPGAFTMWCAGEPNNSQNEDWVYLSFTAQCAGRWNDVGAAATGFGLVELGLYFTYRSPCAGTRGSPALLPGQPPRLGRPFSLHLMNLPLFQFGVLLQGTSKAFWGPLPLPFDLTPLGLTGCSILASGEVIEPLFSNSFGAITWGMSTFPNDGSLLGLRLYHQAFFIDPAANPFGAVATNGGEGRVEAAPSGT